MNISDYIGKGKVENAGCLLGNKSKKFLEGDSDAEAAEMWTKERNGFVLIQKEERETKSSSISKYLWRRKEM